MATTESASALATSRLLRLLAARRGGDAVFEEEVASVWRDTRDDRIAIIYLLSAAVSATAFATDIAARVTGSDLAAVELEIDRALAEIRAA